MAADFEFPGTLSNVIVSTDSRVPKNPFAILITLKERATVIHCGIDICRLYPWVKFRLDYFWTNLNWTTPNWTAPI